MEIAICIKKVLQDYGLDTRGITQKMAKATGVHRHTISRLYNNDMKNPPLGVLGQICDYLVHLGVPADVLPQALFGAKPAELWKALFAQRKVTMYLGEYEKLDEPVPTRRWISRRDASVAAQIIEHLSKPADRQKPQFHTEYVTFRFNPKTPSELAENEFREDNMEAIKKFKAMRARPSDEAAILIGSQRVNYLTEHFVADLFRCKPFPEPGQPTNVPFFLLYRTYDRPVSSCFGDRELPGLRGAPVPGTYYRNKDGRWACCPWVLNERDAGIVIVVYDTSLQSIEVALLGFSGRGTETIGKQFVQNGQQFWTKRPVTLRGRSVAVYICEMTFVQTGSAGRDETLHLKSFRANPLDYAVLRGRLA